jgi:hypothetical protein
MQGDLEDNKTTINIESLAKGMYYIKIGEKIAKFAKE